MTADAATTDVGVSVLVADTAIGVASDMMLCGNDVEFQKQVQQQESDPADLPIVVEQNAVGGINRVVRIILITFIIVILSSGVGFFMFRLLGKFTTYAILNLLHIYNLARTWTSQPNENNNPDLWWWQRRGRTKVILMATHTYNFCVFFILMMVAAAERRK